MDELPYREETDSMGIMRIPTNRYYGAQTARSLIHFSIGHEKIPKQVIRALGLIKYAAANTNCDLGLLPKEKAKAIMQASKEVADGLLDDEFPLYVWQTGSGTQSNMNVNEVVANRAIELLGGKMGDHTLIHPNDHVNLSQSSNDTFPTAMRIASFELISETLLPSLTKLKNALQEKQKAFTNIIKIGRTHLMDATPLFLGQEFSGYVEQLCQNIHRIEYVLKDIRELPLGGTAVGTGLNAHPDFAKNTIALLAKELSYPFIQTKNTFAAMAAHDPLVFASSALKTLACSLCKIATDLSWMGSGPRAGLAELFLPQNEPGSSIMPGKVNPTQCEAMKMVCVQVIGNDTAISMAGSLGNFELNVFKPLIIYNLTQSITLLSDAMHRFTDYLVTGLKANEKKIEESLLSSLMLVTALTPIIGYDKAATMAHTAFKENISLAQACEKLGYLSREDFLKHTDPKKML